MSEVLEPKSNPYEGSIEDLLELTADLLKMHPPQEGQRYVCYEVQGVSKYAQLGRVLEREIFEKSFNNSAAQMLEEYTEFEESSRFFVSIDVETKSPTGVIRAIEGTNLKELKTTHDLLRDQSELFDEPLIRIAHSIDTGDRVWDIGTLGVVEEYRSKAGVISIQLYRAMYNAAMREDVEHLVAIIDQKPYEKLTKYLGVPFVKLASRNAFEYLGSELSQPVYGYVPEFYEIMSQKKLPIIGRGIARAALDRLVYGSEDDAIYNLIPR